MTINEYIDALIHSYADDPADTPYQQGYLDLAKEIKKCIAVGAITVPKNSD